MTARIVSAEEARGLLEGATPGPPLEEDGWWPPYVNGACPECGRKRGHADWCTLRAEFNRVAAARAALSKAAPDLAHTVTVLEGALMEALTERAGFEARALEAEKERDAALARVARLERVLAVEAGDASQAPEGWSLNDSGHWTKGKYCVIHPSYWALCEVGDLWFRPFNFALEAMEAADAAGEVAT